ncbi:MAG: hypothetical protein JWM36_138 [Hyphomicrobiales bacterium]|nr:hypothetical protein [Hyphomicrobiales bacterium]
MAALAIFALCGITPNDLVTTLKIDGFTAHLNEWIEPPASGGKLAFLSPGESPRREESS